MRSIAALWRHEPHARPYFIAVGQSAIGTGAGYVALLLVAYERFAAPWAISLVLLADLVPSILLGPVLGSVVDRLDRLRCAIAADLLCASAIAAMFVIDGFVALLGLALVAGLGNALFRPASNALVPALVADERLPAANGLYRALRDSSMMLGPALAALVLLFAAPNGLLLFDAATFAVSAALLSRLRGVQAAAAPEDEEPAQRSLLGDTRAGLCAIRALPAVPALLLICAASALFGGLMNVAELLLARDELGGGAAGYGLLVAAYGVGQVTGALLGAREGDDGALRRRLVAALALDGVGLVLSGLAPQLALAAATFFVTAVGNGVLLVCSGALLQRLVPAALHGRIFGVVGALESLAIGAALLGSGAVVAALGVRGLFLLAGAGTLTVTIASRPALTGRARPPRVAASTASA